MSEHPNRLETTELKALIQIAQLITTLDLDRVLAQMLQIMTDLFNAKKGSIFLIDPDGIPYRKFILQRNLEPEMSRVVVSRVLHEGLAGWCVREKRGAVIDDVTTDGRWLILPNDTQQDVRSAMSLPILLNDQPQGVITLVSDTIKHFSNDALELATAIAGQASMVVHNAYLFDSVRTYQRQLEVVLQNVGEPVFMLDENMQILLANRDMAKLLDVPVKDLIGRRIDKISTHRMWIDLAQQLATYRDETITPLSLEMHDDAAERDFLVNIAVTRAEARQLNYVIVFIDVTSMQDLSRLKTHMLRMASHDLKNPLNIAMGYVNMMQSDMGEGVAIEPAWIDEVFRALERMNHLIDELLDEKRIERESRFRSREVNPYHLIQEAVESLEEQITWKHLHLVQDIAPEMSHVRGDRTQLRQAMVNYLSNAIKYTPKSGKITLHAYIEHNKFYFSVEDTGVGIPEALQPQIFRPGYRAERDSISEVEGSGFGLSLVAEICRRHKGNVWFESKENVGSTFGFWIPVAP